MEQLEKLGSIIRSKRNQLHLTQMELAEICKLSDATIRYIETGKQGVSISNWAIVANVLGLELQLRQKKMRNETRKGL